MLVSEEGDEGPHSGGPESSQHVDGSPSGEFVLVKNVGEGRHGGGSDLDDRVFGSSSNLFVLVPERGDERRTKPPELLVTKGEIDPGADLVAAGPISASASTARRRTSGLGRLSHLPNDRRHRVRKA